MPHLAPNNIGIICAEREIPANSTPCPQQIIKPLQATIYIHYIPEPSI